MSTSEYEAPTGVTPRRHTPMVSPTRVRPGDSGGHIGVDYVPPDADVPGEAVSFQASSLEPDGIPERLLDAHREIEQALLSQDRTAATQTVEAFAAPEVNIQGVAIGLSLPGEEGEPGAPTLQVFVAESTTPDQVRATLGSSMGIQSVDDDEVPITVVEEVFEAFVQHPFQIRPAPGGVSCGHVDVTAGTLGCLATGRSSPRNKYLLALSNNHVFANSNKASEGDAIVQPGVVDLGRPPDDQIGVLERAVNIDVAGVNYLDCATAWCWPENVRKELIFLSKGQQRFFRIGSTPAKPTVGMLVGKSGRTTGLTHGYVESVRFSGWVDYREAGKAFFAGQVVIRSGNPARVFSRGGDSGSIVYEWASERRPVGLLFAGGSTHTLANPLEWVVDALDIDLVT